MRCGECGLHSISHRLGADLESLTVLVSNWNSSLSLLGLLFPLVEVYMCPETLRCSHGAFQHREGLIQNYVTWIRSQTCG